MWFNLAGASGDSPHAAKGRDLLAKQMTPQQIAQAQEMAQRCKASQFKQCGEPTQTAGKRSPDRTPSPSKAEATKSQGSGFFVSKDGYLITNAHVVESCDKIVAINVLGQEVLLRKIRVSKSDDLALLKADTKLTSVAVFRESAKLNQGESVIAYGFPLGGLLASGGNVTTGNVTALSGLRDDGRQMQISAPVQPGNSGGPLVDSRGLLIGVVTSKLDAMKVAQITDDIPQNVNFAIKASSVKNLLDSNSVKYESKQPMQSSLPVDVLTRELKKYTTKIECN